MKITTRILLMFITGLCWNTGLAQEDYPAHPDSQKQPGVPTGAIAGPFQLRSNIYPGTVRDYWVYVPAQYDPLKATCSIIVQDGVNCAESWKLPTVLDNLIHKKELPVMVGIFVQWGKVEAGEGQHVRYNRSFEYDAMGDRYARFLLEELIPDVSKKYNLSTDPNDRMLAGQSSGAICALNAAWERPNAFRRVYSGIGTYVGLRGGDEFSTLVRKYEPKPLRIFLEDGSNDLDIYAGHWWTANQSMLAALTWAGYEVEHNWGTGGHNGRHSAAILPDAMRWLWKDYPSTVERHMPKDNRIKVLVPGEYWIPLDLGPHKVTCLTADGKGTMYVFSQQKKLILKIASNGSTSTFAPYDGRLTALAYGAEGLYGYDSNRHQILRITESGKPNVVLKDVSLTNFILSNEYVLFTDDVGGKIGIFNTKTKKLTYSNSVPAPTSLSLYPEETFVLMGSKSEPFGYSLRFEPDGSLTSVQPYVHYHIPYGSSVPAPVAMVSDTDGNLYSLTNMGVQISDQLGRINIILELPQKNCSSLSFGGEYNGYLYTIADGTLYRRKLNVKGYHPSMGSIKPPTPGL